MGEESIPSAKYADDYHLLRPLVSMRHTIAIAAGALPVHATN
jgi:hypothetical protein